MGEAENRIADTAIINPNVELGSGVRVDDWAVLGYWGGKGEEPPPLSIGDNSIIRTHSVIYAGVEIGDRFHIGHHALVREFTQIGSDVSIGSGTVIEHRVSIGNGVRIHSNAFIPEFTTLEDQCWIGPNVVMTNARYPLGLRVKEELEGPVIRSHAIVGANVTLLPGVEIGAGALVGAASVVRKDVPPLTIVAGSPARFVGRVDELAYEDEVQIYQKIINDIGGNQ